MQQGGSQYGAPPPDMNPFASAGTPRSRADHVLGGPASEQQPGTSAQQPPLVETASPIASRAPPRGSSLAELAPGGPAGFPDDDALAAAGEEADRGGAPGNRWPRQETLALLKIRSEMDAAFRDATLKAPLWEDVTRKLAELGYTRSAKKCKEKFENVHKYYKRTKDGRAGRQDGKSYRFFSQLEALHSSGGGGGGGASSTPAAPVPATSGGTPNTVASSIGMVGSSGNLNPTPLNAIPPAVGTAPTRVVPDPMAGVSGPSIGISFSATSSSSASESEEDTEEGLTGEPRKRKRRGGGDGGSGRKMMAFFEELMRQVMERQEAMQQRFLEAIEKREQDRMIREEAWKRQEVARLTREHEMMAQERAMSASRDAAIIAFLQKMTGQTVQVPVPVPVPAPVPDATRPQPPSQQHPPPAPVSPPPPEQTRPPPPQRSQSQQPQPQQITPVRSQATSLEIVPVSEAPEVVATGSAEPASSRWPKSEVLVLIKLRTELESRYQEAGPKGPLWEEIASLMQRMGYNRSSKRCKEKWENINKYYKKVKESNKKRPEDSKTCPYFHELDAIYRKKHLGSSGGGGVGSSKQPEPMTADPHPQQPPPLQSETEGKSDAGGGGNSNSNGDRNGGGGNGGTSSAATQKAQTSNGGLKPGIFEEGMGGSGSTKKPEDIVKELMIDQQQQQRQHHQPMMVDYDKPEELEGEDTEQDGDEDDEDEEDGEMGYRIHYQQRAGVNGTANGGAKELAAAAGSFMAMM
ncbi:hypothetical protein Taro_053242 [Colocasia esculenta]|uniref:Myb-like domain-containing protein n=1 Tax=Colocasia esculenta TaxID=4460 RepID=A0A843XLL9_COLES|nr:hypothetical protein [Colocasia esculenta]